VTVRTLFSLAAAVGIGLSSSFADDANLKPAQKKAAMKNQKLADEVAAKIASSGTAAGARLTVNVQGGVVDLSGEIVSMKQAEMLIQLAKAVHGVSKVDTHFSLMTGDIQRVQGFEPAPVLPPPSQLPGSAGAPQDPVPLAAPGMPSYDMTGPRMPPYAWPTYAPYNNLSRVAYPQAYPYNAFPFIGPYYPFPKVPLGWRSVKLEWDDGHWYLGRLSTPHDYWRTKFW
jgi:hypothetical protein